MFKVGDRVKAIESGRYWKKDKQGTIVCLPWDSNFVVKWDDNYSPASASCWCNQYPPCASSLNASFLKLIKPDKKIEDIRVIRNGMATIIILPDGSKGVAVCNPADKYSEEYGFILAYQRAKERQYFGKKP